MGIEPPMRSSPGCVECAFAANPARGHTIFPLFLPFAGCGARCVFCSQRAQTGQDEASGFSEIMAVLAKCERELAEGKRKNQPAPELAFYGGTFTGLRENSWRLCLDFVKNLQDKSLVSGFRCSTRPDKLPDNRLHELYAAGCRLVELGIQTFSEKPLKLSGRGYAPDICKEACRKVLDNGMAVCAHLMSGLPGSLPQDFLEDVELALALGVRMFRFSPCLVLEGTALAKSWRNGQYEPWSMETALDYLASACLMAANSGARVIRIGLAPEDQLLNAILAGPAHMCLGSRVRGRALLRTVENMLRQLASRAGAPQNLALYVPARHKGDIWGWKRELAPDWLRMGISKSNVFYWNNNYLRLRALP